MVSSVSLMSDNLDTKVLLYRLMCVISCMLISYLITMRIAFLSWLCFLVLCLWIHLFVHNSVVSAQCLEDQRSFLLQLNSSLTFPYAIATKLASWTETIDCCEWGGVSCDSKGHVVGLDLSHQFIFGEIGNSTALFSLHYLQDLNLAYNYFTSVIPSAIHNLTNIIHLNFSHAGFSGQIPIDISHLTSLVTLDLSSFHDSTGELGLKLENPNLQKLVQNLTGLRKLYLDGVSISAEGEEWCAALLSLPSLQELSLWDCHLSGGIHSLARLEHLTKIILDANNLSSPVPETFSNLKNLTTLSLSSCNLRGTFPHNIFQLGALSFIDISSNRGLHGFLPDFPLHASLNTLIVSNTNFSGPLPNSICNLSQLSKLDLSNCQFNGTLPMSMSNLNQLVHLDLSYNRFVGPIPSLNKCKKLIRVRLSSNNFTSTLPSTHFEGLLSLEEVDLHNNSLTGRIPSSLFVLPSMRNILLSENKFDGELHNFLNWSSRIESLHLSNNHLEGPIPMSLFQLTQLRDLQLSFNKFIGKIELNMIRKLGNLNVLDLSYNNLSVIDRTNTAFPSFPNITSLSLASCKLTTFPNFLRNQSKLGLLDLSNNNLIGKIPSWLSNFSLYHLNLSYNYLTKWEEPDLLSNMSFLTILDIHSNRLQGPLPVLPQFLIYLDFSNNNFTSLIPPNIGSHLLTILFLSFSSNKLHGNIPESLCNAPNLQVLDLSNNSLTGTIPKCLIAMNGTLSILNLRRNNLAGAIDTFPGSCNLRTVDLHGNVLRGKIPKYLATCTMLEVLDLGNNQIDDQFPCWLKNIPTLHVLIMGSNKFHGSLKCPEYSQVAWSHLHIIDLAFNNFSGIIPPSFFQTMKAMTLDQNDDDLPKLQRLQFQVLGDNYYHDKVTVTSKNLRLELVKILTIFTSIDLSSNNFEGPIPKELGQLRVLYILNLSHNAFLGHIPSSIGTMNQVESLDLSYNTLSGEIPAQMANLSFLSLLNLSYNHLVGRIPSGSQIQTFEGSSFIGNEGLCGPPLTPNCSGDGGPRVSERGYGKSDFGRKSSIDWNFISVEIGFAFGIGTIFLLLVFWRPWRIWYWKRVETVLYWMFPQLDFVYEYHAGKSYRVLRWKSY